MFVDLARKQPVTQPYTANSNTGTMTFGSDSFVGNLQLGIDITHETWHAWDILNGNNISIFNFSYQKDSINADFIHKSIMEYRAYDFELQYAPSSMNRDGLDYLRKNFNRIVNTINMDPDYFLKKW